MENPPDWIRHLLDKMFPTSTVDFVFDATKIGPRPVLMRCTNEHPLLTDDEAQDLALLIGPPPLLRRSTNENLDSIGPPPLLQRSTNV